MESLQIYIHRNGQRTGPYALDEARSHLRSGALTPDDFAWYEGAPDWMALSSVPGITAAPRSLPAPPKLHVEMQPGKRIWFILGAIASVLFSLVVLLVTLLWFTDTGAGKHASLAPLFFGLFATVVGICLAAQFLVALRGESAGYCQVCKRSAPTINVSINRHIGALVLMFHKSLRGSLCKRCITKSLAEYTFTTLLLGWWGFVSFFVTPIVLINNLMVFVRSQFMPSSH